MAVGNAQVSIGTSATRLDADETTLIHDGVSVAVRNTDAAASVFLGNASVTTGNGYELKAGVPLAIDLQPGESLYAVAASGTVVVHALRSGL